MNAGTPRLSVVAPVHDEAPVLRELATRCLAAARRVDPAAEVVLVDDASTDDTPAIVPTLPDGVRVIRLDVNRGQLGATLEGLRHARGSVVVVIDGDLQDPPELLPELVAALHAAPAADVVFAAKTARHEGPIFRAARAVYGLLARLPGTRAVPPGVGAYCAMRADLARRAAALRVRDANLAPVLLALGARARTVPYEKRARYDGVSRVGPWGLVREGLGSLVLTGTAGVLARAAAVLALAVALGRRSRGAAALAGGLFVAGRLADRATRGALRPAEDR